MRNNSRFSKPHVSMEDLWFRSARATPGDPKPQTLMCMQAHPPPTTISRLGISFRFSAPVDDTILHAWQTLVTPSLHASMHRVA